MGGAAQEARAILRDASPIDAAAAIEGVAPAARRAMLRR